VLVVPSFAHGTHPSPGSRQRHDERLDPRRMARLAEAWEPLNCAAGDVAGYNLERKPFVFNVFAWLAEAARG
jgi:hypothetical protein